MDEKNTVFQWKVVVFSKLESMGCALEFKIDFPKHHLIGFA